MKHWPSQLFPIILLALLAGLTFWLQNTVDRDTPANDGKLRHEADAVAENFTVRRFDARGEVKYRLISPYMVHYPDDDSSELTTPTVVAYRPGTPDLTLSARKAIVTAKGETVLLRDDVTLVRQPTETQPLLTARMPELTVQPEAGIAFTATPVDVAYGKSTLRGIGMQFDNNNSTLVLQSQVRGVYVPPGVQP